MKEKTYYVDIKFNSEALSPEDLMELLKEEVEQKNILSIDGYIVKIACQVPFEGFGELQNELYYLLDGGRNGTFLQYELK